MFLLLCGFRLLGTLDLGLREVVSKGKQSVHSTLKGKKGDMLDVRFFFCNFVLDGFSQALLCESPSSMSIPLMCIGCGHDALM